MNQQERVYAVDLARGLAVGFMIWVHVLLTYSTPEVVNSIFGIIIGFLGSPPAAPVFMTLMGLSFYYSRNKDLKSGIRRGLQIILFGYLLNFFRGVLPVYMTGLLSPSKAAGIPAAVADYTDAFLELDILQFAGLAFIVMSLIRYCKVNKYVLLFLALVIAVISPYMWAFRLMFQCWIISSITCGAINPLPRNASATLFHFRFCPGLHSRWSVCSWGIH